MGVEQPPVIVGLASRVRSARADRGWTLDELARRSSVSRRLLVQIEHAQANPSLATLLKLAAALGITLTDLVAEAPSIRPVGVVPATEARTLWSTPAGSSGRLLVSRGPLELWSWTLAPGDRRDSERHRPGSVELLTVATGIVAVEVGADRVQVASGDSAWFDATDPHSYSNPAATQATFTLVVWEPA